jgi:hypothetical protein
MSHSSSLTPEPLASSSFEAGLFHDTVRHHARPSCENELRAFLRLQLHVH